MSRTVSPEVISQQECLVPCQTCGRTFLPVPLRKHERVCQKNATRKRKPFNSLRQRIEGTDLAVFHMNQVLKPSLCQPPPPERPEPKSKPSRWKEKHQELVNAIRAARGAPVDTPTKKTSSMLGVGNERCPSCDRQFGPKAFDRHVEWCKEHKARLQRTPVSNQLAKERLEARTKYRVPPLSKSKRTVREKYSNVTPDKEVLASPTNVKSYSTTNLQRTQSLRKPNSITNIRKKPEPKLKLELSSITSDKNSPYTASPTPKIMSESVRRTPRQKKYNFYTPKINSEDVNNEILDITVSQLCLGGSNKKMVTWKDSFPNAFKPKNNIIQYRQRRTLSPLKTLPVIEDVKFFNEKQSPKKIYSEKQPDAKDNFQKQQPVIKMQSDKQDVKMFSHKLLPEMKIVAEKHPVKKKISTKHPKKIEASNLQLDLGDDKTKKLDQRAKILVGRYKQRNAVNKIEVDDLLEPIADKSPFKNDQEKIESIVFKMQNHKNKTELNRQENIEEVKPTFPEKNQNKIITFAESSALTNKQDTLDTITTVNPKISDATFVETQFPKPIKIDVIENKVIKRNADRIARLHKILDEKTKHEFHKRRSKIARFVQEIPPAPVASPDTPRFLNTSESSGQVSRVDITISGDLKVKPQSSASFCGSLSPRTLMNEAAEVPITAFKGGGPSDYDTMTRQDKKLYGKLLKMCDKSKYEENTQSDITITDYSDNSCDSLLQTFAKMKMDAEAKMGPKIPEEGEEEEEEEEEDEDADKDKNFELNSVARIDSDMDSQRHNSLSNWFKSLTNLEDDFEEIHDMKSPHVDDKTETRQDSGRPRLIRFRSQSSPIWSSITLIRWNSDSDLFRKNTSHSRLSTQSDYDMHTRSSSTLKANDTKSLVSLFQNEETFETESLQSCNSSKDIANDTNSCISKSHSSVTTIQHSKSLPVYLNTEVYKKSECSTTEQSRVSSDKLKLVSSEEPMMRNLSSTMDEVEEVEELDEEEVYVDEEEAYIDEEEIEVVETETDFGKPFEECEEEYMVPKKRRKLNPNDESFKDIFASLKHLAEKEMDIKKAVEVVEDLQPSVAMSNEGVTCYMVEEFGDGPTIEARREVERLANKSPIREPWNIRSTSAPLPRVKHTIPGIPAYDATDLCNDSSSNASTISPRLLETLAEVLDKNLEVDANQQTVVITVAQCRKLVEMDKKKLLSVVEKQYGEKKEAEKLLSGRSTKEESKKDVVNNDISACFKDYKTDEKSVYMSGGDGKKKGLPTLKKTTFEASPKPSLKTKADVDHYFNEKARMNSEKEAAKMEEQLTAGNLFSVDDEMFEEFMKYEAEYRREKEQQKNNTKKVKPKVVDNFGILTGSEDEQTFPQINNNVPNDSAYGSLQRKTPKQGNKTPKLSPLEQHRADSCSSSGSEQSANSPAPLPAVNGRMSTEPSPVQRLSKFCHECGNRYPVTTAKFCVECGVKRLVL
ncbi:uncharacterized protein LOC109604014 isoform X3 [Aethina tumida]|uniref:uncharacterized protein LOC109604014 isoform X3 n=1 Tax=Aethina tumida TaxID=116153 RepID=UPI00214979D9|nr:uncharacterized protein LOC109604014 isoform X3 [Aethina tumida]